MNRDFEQEYKEYMQSEIPDLWSRISKGIDEEERATSLAKPHTVEPRKVKRNNRQKMTTFFMIGVAACVCGCVLIPLGMMGIIGGSNKMSDSVGFATAAEESLVDENVVMEADVMMPAEPQEPVAKEAVTTDSADGALNTKTEETPLAETEMLSGDVNGSDITGMQGAAMEDAVLCASEITVLVESAETAEEGTRYTLSVVNGDTTDLVTDERGTISARTMSENVTIVVGSQYIVNLYDTTPWLSSIPVYEMELMNE